MEEIKKIKEVKMEIRRTGWIETRVGARLFTLVKHKESLFLLLSSIPAILQIEVFKDIRMHAISQYVCKEFNDYGKAMDWLLGNRKPGALLVKVGGWRLFMTVAPVAKWEDCFFEGDLVVHNVRKEYGGVVALECLNMVVAPHQHISICGANAAGKSTLHRIISGEEEPTSGQVFFSGELIAG